MSAERTRGTGLPSLPVAPPVLLGGVAIALAAFLALKYQLFARSYAPVAGLVGGLLAGLVATRTRSQPDGVAWQGVRAGALAVPLSFLAFVGFDVLIVLRHGVEPVSGFGTTFRLDWPTRLLIFAVTEGAVVFLYSVTMVLGSAVGTWIAYTAALLAGERLRR